MEKKIKELSCKTLLVDLWTTPFSDCTNISSWHAPTAYDIIQFIKSQNPKNTSLEEVIEYVKKHFIIEKNWEKLMRKYWEEVNLFI